MGISNSFNDLVPDTTKAAAELNTGQHVFASSSSEIAKCVAEYHFFLTPSYLVCCVLLRVFNDLHTGFRASAAIFFTMMMCVLVQFGCWISISNAGMGQD